MSYFVKKLVAGLLLSAFVLTGCQQSVPAEEPAASSSAPAQSVQVSEPEPEPEPEPDPELEPDPEPEQAVLAPALTQEDVEAALDEISQRYDYTAVAVAVIENGVVTRSGARGWAVKDKREMTPDTKVRAASLSKVAVGMCAMKMAQDGLIDLNAPLSDYWGSGVKNPYTESQPTALTLMTHTSSLKDQDITRGLSKLTGLLKSSSSWRKTQPGAQSSWYYSNFGLCVLGTTLELAANQLLDDYFQSQFLQRLGVTASFHAGKLQSEQVACLYNSAGTATRTPAQQTGQSVPEEIGMGASYFPGGLTISVEDMAKLTAILAGDGSYEGEQYLSPESVEEMETPQFTVTPSDRSPFQQCLILRRQEDILGQSALYYHTGSAYGVYHVLSYNPDTRNGVVVFSIGAELQLTDRGLYAICSDLSQLLYEKMEGAV